MAQVMGGKKRRASTYGGEKGKIVVSNLGPNRCIRMLKVKEDDGSWPQLKRLINGSFQKGGGEENFGKN